MESLRFRGMDSKLITINTLRAPDTESQFAFWKISTSHLCAHRTLTNTVGIVF